VIAFRADLKIWVAAQPVDFRKSIHTLSALVSEVLRANPYGGDVLVFRSKRSDRVKLLAWCLVIAGHNNDDRHAHGGRSPGRRRCRRSINSVSLTFLST
jgi:hypothetical protein